MKVQLIWIGRSLSKSLRWLRARKRWLANLSPFVAFAYLLFSVAIVLLLVPSRAGISWAVWLVAAAFLSLVAGQRRKPGPIEMAIVTIVLAQVAAARWSMILDDEASRRDARAQEQQEAREIARDERDSTRRVLEAREQDQRNLRVVREGLWYNHRAAGVNEAICKEELGMLDRSQISLAATWPLEMGWWEIAVERRPTAIAHRPDLMDSLRYVADVTRQMIAMLADRRAHLDSEGQLRVAPAGGSDPFHRRQRKLDNSVVLVSKELRRVIANFQDHFERDTLNYQD